MRYLSNDPHLEAAISMRGTPLDDAKAAVLMLHGRGASAADILTLSSHFEAHGVAYIAPQAAGNSWYPQWFMSNLEDNHLHLDSALSLLKRMMQDLCSIGVSAERILILGFSQGACLASEFAVRNVQRLGGIVAISGGLMGPEGTVWDYPGSLEGTPVYLGCSDVDLFIPLQRVHETGQILEGKGGQVRLDIFPGMGHEVNQQELGAVSWMVQELVLDQHDPS